MNLFPFDVASFPPEDPTPPLWRPKPGNVYFVPETETAQIWVGNAVDQKRLLDGKVFKSLFASTEMNRWLTAMGKLMKYAALFHREGEPHLWVIEKLNDKLVVCEDGRPSVLPSFHSKELARLALESLNKQEHDILIRGRTWM